MQDANTVVSLVVPVFNEEEAIPLFHHRIREILGNAHHRLQFVFVNDGSTDRSLEILLALREEHNDIHIVDLSRNFGKEAALTAGLSAAEGACTIITDVDLQDPPELIPQMIDRWEKGAEVVVAIRSDRSSDSLGKRVTARWFYRVFNSLSETQLPDGSGDFRLMDRNVVEAFLLIPERNRFNKGLFAWLGFRQEFITHVRNKASRAGTRWHPLRLFGFAFDGIFSFSSLPIRIWSLFGAMVAIFSIGYGIYLISRTLTSGVVIPGYASTIVAVLFFGGLNLFTMGILGEYIGRIMVETKRRPLYVVRKHYDGTGDDTADREA